MRRFVAVVSLMLLSGCGSCIEDKKAPAEQPAPTPQIVRVPAEGGKQRPIVVRDAPFSFSSLRDAGD